MNALDQELVVNCLQGNESAWEDLIRSHERRIYSLSYRFTRCRSEAEDMTQDVFLRVYQTLNSYRGEAGGLSSWLICLARNLLIDRCRKARRELHIDPNQETELSVMDPRAPDPLQCAARNEAAVMVHAALRRLSPDTRSVIVLHEIHGLTFSEVAAILQIPEGTVKSRMIRGHRELARILRSPADQRKRAGSRLSGRRPGSALSRHHVLSGDWRPNLSIKESSASLPALGVRRIFRRSEDQARTGERWNVPMDRDFRD